MLKFIKKYAWVSLLLFLLLLFPQSLSDQAKLNMRIIITGVGIDYIDNQYQVTSQVVLPANGTESGGISAHISYLTASGNTISECIQKVSYKLGKLAELSHMEFIMVGETMKDHNLASSLDYFIRNFKLKKSIMLLACHGTAKSSILKTQELELGVALSLQKIYISNESSLNSVETSYVDFISDTYSTCGCSVLDTFVISTSQDSSSQEQSSQQNSSTPQQSAGSQQGQSLESAKMRTKTPLILFKKGKYAGEITNEDMVLGYYFTNKKAKTGNIFLTNFSFGDIQNANINIRVDNMNKNNNISFQDNKIIHTININLNEIKIDEIAPQNSSNLTQYKQLPQSTQNQILSLASNKIKELINSTFTYCQQLNFDIFKTANLGYQKSPAQWQNFTSLLDNSNDYLKNVEVVVNVTFNRIN